MKQQLQLLLVLLCLSYSKIYAQDKESLENELLQHGFTSFAEIKKDKPLQANSNNKMSLLKAITKSNNSITFEKVSSQTIEPGLEQDKFQLYKNGIKVKGGEYLIHSGAEGVSFVHGFLAEFENENFVTGNKAEEDRFSAMALETFNKNHQNQKGFVEDVTGVIKEVQPVYYFDNNKEKYRAAYQVKVVSKNGLFVENVFVSAVTGEFLGAESLRCTINFPGTAQTQYNGNRNIVADAPTAAGPFRLQEIRNGVLIRTRNMNNQQDFSNVTNLTDNDNAWTAAEHGVNRAAFDAHWGAETVFDYWRTVHNRNSIDGNGLPVESYIHWNTGQPNNFNASWDKSVLSMLYGDGFLGTNPLTALDIAAHEFGHGINQFTGNLAYEKESGALDEGFSDIWGACIEAWATPNKQRWLLGEDVLGGPLRNMSNPNAFGQPDTYLGTNWFNTTGCTPPNDINDYCGVHVNSGVLNFWFFLLSQGGTGTNDIGNTYNVTGIGINDAARIVYRTKLLMNNSQGNYALTRSLSIQAARELFGGTGTCQEIAVTNAWRAVGVGAAYVPTNSITGNSYVCTSGTFTLAVAPGAVASWTATPNNVATLAPNGNSVTVTRQTAGTIQLRANMNTCGGPAVSVTKSVTVGMPSSVASISGATPVYTSSYYYYSINLPLGYTATSITWGVPTGWSVFNGQGTTLATIFTGSNPGYVTANVTACGGTNNLVFYSAIGGGGPAPLKTVEVFNPKNKPRGAGTGLPNIMNLPGLTQFNNNSKQSATITLYPNPVNDLLFISVPRSFSIAAAQSNRNEKLTIVIIDANGKAISRNIFPANNSICSINTSGLASGIYTATIYGGLKTEVRRFIVAR